MGYHVGMGAVAGSGRPREQLKALRDGLLRLHKVALDSERGTYEHEIERIRSSGHFLELVLHDPWFAWLHELSELIVIIDETLDSPIELAPADAERLTRQARALLVPSEGGRGFAGRYFDALQRDPAVVLAHGEMMSVFAGLQAGA
jgi:hypothetical protein